MAGGRPREIMGSYFLYAWKTKNRLAAMKFLQFPGRMVCVPTGSQGVLCWFKTRGGACPSPVMLSRTVQDIRIKSCRFRSAPTAVIKRKLTRPHRGRPPVCRSFGRFPPFRIPPGVPGCRKHQSEYFLFVPRECSCLYKGVYRRRRG